MQLKIKQRLISLALAGILGLLSLSVTGTEAKADDTQQASSKTPAPLGQQQVYQRIKDHLERELYTLPMRTQGHYGIRRYRMTGDEKYLNASLMDLYAITSPLAHYACQADDREFVRKHSRAAAFGLGQDPRAIARREALTPFPEFYYYTDLLLRYASRTAEFGLQGPCHDKMIGVLKRADLRPGLTDKAMIEIWAAQLVNYVYWAKQLGVGDYRDDYKQAFLKVYPVERDASLSTAEFRNKLYGMTHFIFAASEYYQKSVDASEFAWILDYFDANSERILKDATEDIIAEVGIGFLLAGKAEHRMVRLSREHITNAFDPDIDLIPSPTGDADLASGEHRNVLAMMLLNWPQRLHKGPLLGRLDATRHHLPKQVTVPMQ
jgi:hypothetical protein